MIHEAIYRLGYIPLVHYEKPSSIGWNQCSRTDKGKKKPFNTTINIKTQISHSKEFTPSSTLYHAK